MGAFRTFAVCPPLGFGLSYAPSTTPEEVLDLFYLAAKWKRPAFIHVRDAGITTPGIIESLQEVIADAAVTGASLHIVHLGSMALGKTPGEAWGDLFRYSVDGKR